MDVHEHMEVRRYLDKGLPPMTLQHPSASKPIVTVLVGSTRYPGALYAAEELLTRAGKVALTVGIKTWSEYGVDTNDFFKQQPWDGLSGLHFKKIDMADEVLVVNPDGYIGRSSAREILYARWIGKPVFYWERSENDEVLPSNEDTFEVGGSVVGVDCVLLVYSTNDCGRPSHNAIPYAQGRGVAFCCSNEAAVHGFFPKQAAVGSGSSY